MAGQIKPSLQSVIAKARDLFFVANDENQLYSQ